MLSALSAMEEAPVPDEVADALSTGIDDDQNGYIDDINGWDFGADDNDPNDDSPTGGHGTHTAGTIVGDGSGGLMPTDEA